MSPWIIPVVLLVIFTIAILFDKVLAPDRQRAARRVPPIVSRDWDDRFTDVGSSRAPAPGRDVWSSRTP